MDESVKYKVDESVRDFSVHTQINCFGDKSSSTLMLETEVCMCDCVSMLYLALKNVRTGSERACTKIVGQCMHYYLTIWQACMPI